MTNKFRTQLLAALSLVLVSVFAAGVCRADFAVGVKLGDWIKYNVENHQQNTLPPYYWLKITVVDVSDTVVSLRSESNLTGYVPYNWTENVAYDCVGTIHFHDLPFVVPANLSVGDYIPEGTTGVFITDMVQRDGREAVYYKGDIDETYWDREKGTLLEYIWNSTETGETLTIKIAETNMWSTGFLGLDWWLWILIIAIPVIVVALFVLTARRRRPARTLPTPSPTQPPPPPSQSERTRILTVVAASFSLNSLV